MKGKLTREFCDSVRYVEGSTKSQQYGDGNGLALRVTPANKMWRFYYEFQGMRRSMSFGSYDMVPLDEARAECDQAREDIKNGLDPFEARFERMKAER